MHAALETWSTGWHGLSLRLRPAEIERLIVLLGDLLQDHGQHFHVSSDYSGAGGLGEIEISVAADSEPDNMWLTSLAIAARTVRTEDDDK